MSTIFWVKDLPNKGFTEYCFTGRAIKWFQHTCQVGASRKFGNPKFSEAGAERCSVKKVVLKSFSKFRGKHLCTRISLLIKRLWDRCFPLNFVKFLIPTFLEEQLRWLLLNFASSISQIFGSFCMFLKISYAVSWKYFLVFPLFPNV